MEDSSFLPYFWMKSCSLLLKISWLFLYVTSFYIICYVYFSIGKRKRSPFFFDDLTVLSIPLECLLQRFFSFYWGLYIFIVSVVDTVRCCLIASTWCCLSFFFLGNLFVELYYFFVPLVCYLSILQYFLLLLLFVPLMHFLQMPLIILCNFRLLLQQIPAVSTIFVDGFLQLFLVLFPLKQILSFLFSEELLLISGLADRKIYLIGQFLIILLIHWAVRKMVFALVGETGISSIFLRARWEEKYFCYSDLLFVGSQKEIRAKIYWPVYSSNKIIRLSINLTSNWIGL